MREQLLGAHADVTISIWIKMSVFRVACMSLSWRQTILGFIIIFLFCKSWVWISFVSAIFVEIETFLFLFLVKQIFYLICLWAYTVVKNTGLFLPAVVRPILDSLESSKEVHQPALRDVSIALSNMNPCYSLQDFFRLFVFEDLA